MKPKVLVCDPIGSEGIRMMEKAGLQVDILKNKATLPQSIQDYEGLVVRSQTKVTAETIHAAKRLKVIVRAGTGTDNIDTETAAAKGIKVLNTPEANTNAACEHAVAMIFAMLRRIPQADSSLRSGMWEREGFVGEELSGKTVGIIGFGRIGRLLAEKFSSLGCHILAYDTVIGNISSPKIKITTLETLLKQSDIVTLHVPLTEETKRMIGEKELAMMKPGSYLANCARGGLVDEGALCEALKSDRLRGAALDVFSNEPPGNSPLFTLPNTVLTPHLGASTEQAKARVGTETAKKVISALLPGNN